MPFLNKIHTEFKDSILNSESNENFNCGLNLGLYYNVNFTGCGSKRQLYTYINNKTEDLKHYKIINESCK
jgi:hypothetical protein